MKDDEDIVKLHYKMKYNRNEHLSIFIFEVKDKK